MRTQTVPSPTGQQPGPEELSWDRPTTFHAKSRTPHDDEPARDFLLRLHSDPTCPLRLTPDGLLMPKDYERARADTVCGQTETETEAVAASSSSVVRRLREGGRLLPGDALRGPGRGEHRPDGTAARRPGGRPDRCGRRGSACGEALRAAMVACDRR